jgi:hypothetical protein
MRSNTFLILTRNIDRQEKTPDMLPTTTTLIWGKEVRKYINLHGFHNIILQATECKEVGILISMILLDEASMESKYFKKIQTQANNDTLLQLIVKWVEMIFQVTRMLKHSKWS